MAFALRGFFLFVFLMGATSCGTKGPIENRKVTIPAASFTCSTADACANIPETGRMAVVYFTTSECTLANMNAGKYAAQGLTVIAPADCAAVETCTDTVSTWYDNAEEAVAITTMPLGYYSLCVFVDGNDSEEISDTEATRDYLGEKTRVLINDLSATIIFLNEFNTLLK
ncbi:hypothetical protein WDW86_07540 [Bdellovibrionota bacterium FG-2]